MKSLFLSICCTLLLTNGHAQCARKTQPHQQKEVVASEAPESENGAEQKVEADAPAGSSAMAQIIQEDKESTKRILAIFSQMITNCMLIFENNKNPVVVGTNLTALFAGIVKIAMEAVRNHDILDDELLADEMGTVELDQELLADIKQQIIECARILQQQSV